MAVEPKDGSRKKPAAILKGQDVVVGKAFNMREDV